MNTTATTLATSVGLGVGATTLVYFLYRRQKQKHSRTPAPPDGTEWQCLGTLKEINIYPIKSCAALQVEEAVCLEDGLHALGVQDRQLFLVNDERKLAYAGWYPNMLSITPELVSEGVLRFSAPNLKPITLDLNELASTGRLMQEGELKKKFPHPLKECKPEHHAWFSQAGLKKASGLKLFIAVKDKPKKTSLFTKLIHIFPLMVLHEKSVQDLNTRLSEADQVNHQQFRGNLIIESDAQVPAYDEDRWLWLRIGDDPERTTLLRYNSDCQRCILVNVDVNTCARNPNFEPLRTLKSYRLRHNPKEPAMGVYFDVLAGGGWLRRGDAVYVQRK